MNNLNSADLMYSFELPVGKTPCLIICKINTQIPQITQISIILRINNFKQTLAKLFMANFTHVIGFPNFLKSGNPLFTDLFYNLESTK